MKKAVLFEKLSRNWVRCTACSWYCKIPPHATGLCAVRENNSGVLYSLVYGYPIVLHEDPIEKKPLFHFLPGRTILSLGTIGCNFCCEFCQNWDISQASKEIKMRLIKQHMSEKLRSEINGQAIKIDPQYVVDRALREHIPAIAYTYNEPSLFVEYASDIAKIAHDHGIKNVFVSNGYESQETLKFIEPYLDAINVDLKSFREKFYREVCKAKLKPVLENIGRIWNMGIWEEVTTLVIPGVNDSTVELTEIANFLVSISPDIPWHVTRFHPEYKMVNPQETPEDTLRKAYEIGKNAGLHFVYIGNILNNRYESTYCPQCKGKIISRNWDQIEMIHFVDGACTNCGKKISGRWI